jgi:DNA-binding MarR family transcriptional regulator
VKCRFVQRKSRDAQSLCPLWPFSVSSVLGFSVFRTATTEIGHRGHPETPGSRNIPLDNSRYNDYYCHMREKRKIARKIRRPETCLEEQVFVNMLRTADVLARGGEALLKPTGLSATQYNVLRILRGAGAEGLACREVGCRMISRDPDITRLLDRMESRALISRARGQEDRRVVKTRITPEGLRVLGELDVPVQEFHRRQLHHLRPKELRTLSRLLERARAQVEAPCSPG